MQFLYHFFLSLELDDTPVVQLIYRHIMKQPEPTDHIKILIIEDDHTYQLLVAESLHDYDNISFEKIVSENAELGLAKFKEERPDIVLLDLNLPDRHGIDLLKELKALDPNTFVVIMTGLVKDEDVENAKALGAMGYLKKPFSLQKMRDVVENFYAFKNHQNDNKPSFFIEKDLHHHDLKDLIKDWNLLFVDDYAKNLKNAQQDLSSLHCHIDVASSGEEALDHTRDVHYNLVFLDSTLSDISMLALAKEIDAHAKQKQSYTYIIGMLDNENELNNIVWKDSGLDDFLVKPCNFVSMKRIIKKYAQIDLENENGPASS